MLLQTVCLAAVVALQFVNAVPLQDDPVNPVSLSYACYRTQVSGQHHDKSTILFLHSLGVSGRVWEGVAEVLALKTGRKVCIVDLRNHGSSPWDPRTDVESMTADVANFIKLQKIEKVNLIGHGLGGKIALHYTLNNADKVNSLVVEDMTPNTVTKEGLQLYTEGFKLLDEAIKSIPNEEISEEDAKKIIVEYVNTKIKEAGFTDQIDEGTAKGIELRCEAGKCQYKMNILLLRNALERPNEILTTSSGTYDGPTLFIYGTKSEFNVNGDRENILKLFPNAKLFGVEGAQHHVHNTHHREFNDEVLKFLGKLED